MKKYLLLILCFPVFSLFGQNTNGRWSDLFSYSNVKYIEEVQGILYCATENGIFLFDSSNPEREWVKYNKTNILSNVGITAMNYDAATNTLIIGYENGSIDLLIDGETQMVLDIPWNSFSGAKKINHIFIQDNVAIISGGFGIASYSLTDREFLETTFFYNNGNYIAVNESAIYNGRVFSATDSGIYSYQLINGTNFPNFYVWQLLTGTQSVGGVKYVELFNGQMYFASNSMLYKLTSDTQFSQVQSFSNIKDLKSNHEILAIAQASQVSFMNSNQSVITHSEDYYETTEGGTQLQKMPINTGIFHNNKYFGGTAKFGLIDFDLTYLDNSEGYKPDGPFNNLSYSLAVSKQKVWIAPGGMSDFNAPTFNADGFYYFDKFKWKHFKSSDLYNAKDFVKISVNPKDDNNFIAIPFAERPNWGTEQKIGMFEFTQNGESFDVNHITSPFVWSYRMGGGAFDKDGDLYVSSSFVDEPSGWETNHYYQRKGQSWRRLRSNKNRPSTALSPDFSSNYIWFPNARTGGVSVLDKNMTEVATLTKSNANLYEDGVLTVAIDQNNNAWIGTLLGLTVLNNADSSIESGNYRTEPVVIIQDGIPEALLTSTRINDIKVDKANRKWIATNAAGVYYVSDNGEQTIYNFTSKNSALPSDTVYDIEIDDSNGKVYFATEKGVVVFNGDVQDVGDNFDHVIAYPNPVRPGFKGNVIIKNIPNRASVKITDVTGNLLYEAKANGGIVEWNTKNSKGKDVASGIYIVLMTNADGTETKTLKIAVVR